MDGGESERLFGGDATYDRHGENRTSSSAQADGGDSFADSAAPRVTRIAARRRTAMKDDECRAVAMAVVLMIERRSEREREMAGNEVLFSLKCPSGFYDLRSCTI